MKITSALAAVGALLMVSSNLQAALITNPSSLYIISGMMTDGRDSEVSNILEGTGFESRSLTLTIDPSDEMVFGMQSSLTSLETSGSLVFKMSHSGGASFATGFGLLSITYLTFEVAGSVTFTVSDFSGLFSGYVELYFNGQEVSSEVPISFTAGTHEIHYSASGGKSLGPGDFTDFTMTADFTAIPEPGTWALLAGGTVVALGSARRRVA